MWLERLQTLGRGEVWRGGGQESEVKVNEGILNQLVSQGFDRAAAQVALRKTNNDDFAALLILTCPEDTDAASKSKAVVEDSASDSNEAKEQRFLDFFRDLGEQYWGWQNESAKRGRGFKGALKENFLPLLSDLRQLASEDLPFSSSPAIAYHALSFLNRGFDECPPVAEDRDRDRHRMSLETAHIVPSLVKRIAALTENDYRSSLTCELVKETFAVLDKLVVSTVAARLSDTAREEGVATIVGFITHFYSLMEISHDNAGLPGASGKLSAVHLHPAIRALSLFISTPASTSVAHLRQVAAQLGQLGEFLEKNDPSVVEAVLSALAAFVQPFARLASADCDAVLAPLMQHDGPVAPRLLLLLATSSHPRIHALVVSFLSSVCQLSPQVVEQLVGPACEGVRMECDEDEDEREERKEREGGGGAPSKALLFDCVARSLTLEGNQVRAKGVLTWVDALLNCITEGHKAQRKDKAGPGGSGGVRLVMEDSDLQRRLSDRMVEEDMEEMELRELLEHDELREDEVAFRSRSGLDAGERRRAELEIRLQRLRRAKISRIQEARMRRRYNAGPEGGASVLVGAGEGSAAAARSLTASPVCGKELVSGTRVKRGPSWKWSSQDGGPGNEGEVVSGTEKNSDGWVRVKWDRGGVNGYRWGAENAYDVEPVDANPLSKAIRDKDVEALLEAAKEEGAAQIRGSAGVLLEVLALAEEGATHGRKDVELIGVLVAQLGADPNKPSGGRLALTVAAERGRCDLVQALLEHGAQAGVHDAEGLTSLQALTRHLERAEAGGALLAELGKALRLLEAQEQREEGGRTAPVRHLRFEKEGGQRCFGRSYPGFRFPSAASLAEEASFTVAVRVKHNEPTGIRSGRSALLCFGRGGAGASAAQQQGFSVMMHTHGHVALGPGLCAEQHGCRFNMAIARGRWAVLTCVHDAARHTLTAFLDGVQQAQVSLDAAGQRRFALDPAGDILIGCTPEGADREDRAKFHGVISEVRVHDRALADAELEAMHSEMAGVAGDAHPELQTAFCEGMCRVLLANQRWSEVDGGACKVRAQVSHLLSRVLERCSADLLASELSASVVRYLELATNSEASPAQTVSRLERRGGSVDTGVPRTLVSVLRCIDAVMAKAGAVFEGPLRRSGLVGKVSSLGSQAGAGPSGAAAELQQDLAQYLVEKYFGGEEGARAPPASGSAVREGLAATAKVLERLAASWRGAAGGEDGAAGGEDEGGALAASAEALLAMKELAALFRQGVYCEELVESGLAAALLQLLEAGAEEGGDVLAWDTIDPFHLLEIGFEATTDERGALAAMVTALRLAADRVPLEHPEAMPLVVAQQETGSPDVLSLKQWVVLSLERGVGDKTLRDLTGTEVQMEPLAFVSTLATTLDAMLETQQPKWKDKDNRAGGRQKELRAMMHAFGDDPEGAPPSLLEHIKHLMVHEHRAIDAVPPITRQFLALPPIHTWDRESFAERGAVKQRLVLGRDSGLRAMQKDADLVDDDDDDDDEDMMARRMAGAGRSSQHLAAGGRASALDALGDRESPATRQAAADGDAAPKLRLRLRMGKTAHDRPGASSARAAMSEFSFVHDVDPAVASSPDAAEECVASTGGRGWLCGYRASLIEQQEREHGGERDRDDSGHSVELRPDETLFEALARLEAVVGSAGVREGSSSHRRAAPQCGDVAHPGRFWERSFVVSYSLADGDGEGSGVERGAGAEEEEEALVEVPKSSLRFVTGRAGCGIRKMERESGARIEGPSRAAVDAVFKVTGSQEEVDDAIALIHSAARASPSWREARDAPILARNPRSAAEAAKRRAEAAGPAASSDDGDGAGEASPAQRSRSWLAEAEGEEAQGEEEVGAPGWMEVEEASSSSAMEGQPVEVVENAPTSESEKGRGSPSLEFLVGSRIRPCILLLHRLSTRLGSKVEGSDAFASTGLGLHIRRQLEDPLVVGSGLVPKIGWVMELCRLGPVVPLAVRERCFTACALGASRALASCSASAGADPVPPVEEGGVSLVRTLGAHSYGMHFARTLHVELRVPQLVRETVEIDYRREGHEDKMDLGQWADKVLKAHGARDTVLDVTWKGEAGHGSGPTRKFFEKVAALLEGDDEEGAAVWRDAGDARRAGLFPAGLPEDNEARTRVLGRLRLVGLFMGKALQQGQMPGLCLAKPLLKLILGQPLGFHDVKDLDDELHGGVVKVVHWRQKKDDVLADVALSEDVRRAQLEDIDRDVCMMWNEDGEQVTCENLDQYTKALVKSCMSKFEIPDQVAAIREGVSLVFPWKMLSLFQPAELQQKLWSDLQWDTSKLERIVRPGPMWPQDKAHIDWLRQEMMAMDMQQRRAFVKFVTASVCMPLEENPIIVHPQVALRPGTEDWDNKLPTCRTCANYLYLPPYSNASILQQRLRLAMWEEHIAFD